MMMTISSVLIAPIGSKPQLVTIAPDLLQRKDENVQEVVVLYATLDRPTTRASIARLGEEFPRTYPIVRPRPICLCDERGIPNSAQLFCKIWTSGPDLVVS